MEQEIEIEPDSESDDEGKVLAQIGSDETIGSDSEELQNETNSDSKKENGDNNKNEYSDEQNGTLGDDSVNENGSFTKPETRSQVRKTNHYAKSAGANVFY